MRDGKVAGLLLSMQLHMSPQLQVHVFNVTTTHWYFTGGRSSCIYAASRATAKCHLGLQLYVFNATTIQWCLSGKGAIAYLPLGMQLQVSLQLQQHVFNAIATQWCFVCGWGSSMCAPLATRLQVSALTATTCSQHNCNYVVFLSGGIVSCLPLGM